ncbi:MAG TPA: hypothetical protein DHW82_13195 [Spirochaetia bacterium]|nr:MAG: hypothetical protein A2Y41_02440 [Spirochaetes bacterium GWB1_36_13]HCL57945.1 hypothetical protein [Spirochaetia bacterium]
MKNGDWKEVAKVVSSGNEYESTTDASDCKDVLGLMLELGYAIPLGDTTTFDLFFRIKVGLNDGFDNGTTKLKSTTGLLGGALTFKF